MHRDNRLRIQQAMGSPGWNCEWSKPGAGLTCLASDALSHSLAAKQT